MEILRNKINPKKLLKSKWTAAEPKNREKHFMVTEVEFDEAGMVTACCIEAIMSRRSISIQWHDLKDINQWIHGWK
ncbi:MAG: TIGR02450 family Trp-rich protein [Gammaproteobacteria bacterium]|nr:TIGR02450 family Trp-rich protein [Gammaproteobacteria bacterium]MDH3986064.1 TIGR02450 family Trp-rich protein [Gammaproteobacteria bacterium]